MTVTHIRPYDYGDTVEVKYAGAWELGTVQDCSPTDAGRFTVLVGLPSAERVNRSCDADGEGVSVRPVGGVTAALLEAS